MSDREGGRLLIGHIIAPVCVLLCPYALCKPNMPSQDTKIVKAACVSAFFKTCNLYMGVTMEMLCNLF